MASTLKKFLGEGHALISSDSGLSTLYQLLVDLANTQNSLITEQQKLRNGMSKAILSDASSTHKVQTTLITRANATADIDVINLLANDVKAKYTTHAASTGNTGAHVAADATNAISAADATNHPTSVTLLGDIKTQMAAHDAQSGVHTVNDTITTSSSVNTGVLFDLLNELKTDYEAHRVLTAGGVHGAADSTNAVTAANATTTATAVTLANDLKTQYEAHRILTASSEHGAADSTNVITAADSTDLATVLVLANDLKTQYEAHRVLTAGSVHGAADSTNTISENDVAELADMVTNVNELKADLNTHIAKAITATDVSSAVTVE